MNTYPIEQAQQFDALVRQHDQRLFAVARRILGDQDDARDAVQDAYASALRGVESFRGDANLSTWLFSIVVNAARMRRRANQRRRETPIDDDALLGAAAVEPNLRQPDAKASPELLFAQRNEELVVRRAIERLPPRYRAVIVLRDLEDRPTDEVARALAISPTAAKVRLHRARRALASILQQAGHGASRAAVVVAMAWLLWAGPAPARAEVPAPVVIELFTSEGCSSCPPADVLLAELEQHQPVPGAHILPLSFHVDYWNRLGWRDPFSSPAASERQVDYVRSFGLEGPYTPQMIVDGRFQFTGSRRNQALAAIAAAASEPRAALRLELDAQPTGDLRLGVRIGPLPAGAESQAQVWSALTESGLTSEVGDGENAGQILRHVGVVRAFERIGIASREGFTGEVTLKPDPAWSRAALRIVVFVQESRSRRIVGAATRPLP